VGTRVARWAFEAQYPLFARAALVSVWGLGLLAAGRSIAIALTSTTLGSDAHAYWLTAHDGLSYDKAPGQVDAFLYSPAFAALTRPVGLLPWPVFLVLWFALSLAVLLWLLRPAPTRWAIPFVLMAVPELIVGNVLILTAAAVVIGMRHPAAWAFPILTKVTTGVGVLWFAFRGEWRHLGIAIGTTSGIVLVAALVDPDAWRAWLEFLLSSKDGSQDGAIAFGVRVVIAIALVAWGARAGQRWQIALAMALATPILNAMTLTLLAAIPRLLATGPSPRDQGGDIPAGRAGRT
jgi:Glycosyltransferase family 87